MSYLKYLKLKEIPINVLNWDIKARKLQKSWSEFKPSLTWARSTITRSNKQIRNLQHSFNNTLNLAQSRFNCRSLRIYFDPRFKSLLNALKLNSI
jgi:hypothetical protein